jgi:hypothetical protein
MIRIMLVTFAVLGWAWYELSGGSDFVPGEHGISLVAEIRPVREQPLLPRPVFQTRDVADIVPPKPRVTSLSERSVLPAKTVRVPENDPPSVAQPAPVQSASIAVPGVTFSADSDNFAARLTETIRNSAPPPPQPTAVTPPEPLDPDRPGPSIAGLGTSLPLGSPLGTGAATQVLPEVFSDDSLDLRRVTGTRVNLRGGPATDFQVLTQLFQGDEVEVLDETGDGWVKLRTLDAETVGWMSDDFLSSAD